MEQKDLPKYCAVFLRGTRKEYRYFNLKKERLKLQSTMQRNGFKFKGLYRAGWKLEEKPKEIKK